MFQSYSWLKGLSLLGVCGMTVALGWVGSAMGWEQRPMYVCVHYGEDGDCPDKTRGCDPSYGSDLYYCQFAALGANCLAPAPPTIWCEPGPNVFCGAEMDCETGRESGSLLPCGGQVVVNTCTEGTFIPHNPDPPIFD